MKRKDLPQIQIENLPNFVKYLENIGAGVQIGTCDPGMIRPVQNKINASKVNNICNKVHKDPEWIIRRPLIISKEGVILDGHHRWAASKNENMHQISVIKIRLPFKEAYNLMVNYDKSFYKDLDEMDLSFRAILPEDWKFEPMKADYGLPANDHSFDMSHDDDDEERTLPDYKYSVDNGTKKTDKIIKKYHNKNRRGARDIINYDKPENQHGTWFYH